MQIEIKIAGVAIWGQSKLFQAFQIIQSLWQLFKTAIIAWKQPKIVYKNMGKAVFK